MTRTQQGVVNDGRCPQDEIYEEKTKGEIGEIGGACESIFFALQSSELILDIGTGAVVHISYFPKHVNVGQNDENIRNRCVGIQHEDDPFFLWDVAVHGVSIHKWSWSMMVVKKRLIEVLNSCHVTDAINRCFIYWLDNRSFIDSRFSVVLHV